MQKRFFSFILFSLFMICQGDILNAQSHIMDKVAGNIYSLNVKYENPDCNIINLNGQKIIQFTGLDENYLENITEANLPIPSKDLFIAIPFNTRPGVNVKINSRVRLEGIPDFIYKTANSENQKLNNLRSQISKIKAQDSFELKGYLWVGNNYCIHLRIHTLQLSPENLSIFWNKEFTIELTFNKPLPNSFSKENYSFLNTKNQKRDYYSKIICNPDFATTVESKPHFEIKSDDKWIDYSKTYLKFGAASDGIYRITYKDLEDFGVNISSIDARTFQLWNRGKQIPIYISSQDPQQLDKSGSIEFVGIRNMGGKHREVNNLGEPYNEYLGRYTDTSIYWLTWGGGFGERVKLADGNNTASVTDTLEYYNEIIHIENNSWFDFSMADQSKRESPYWLGNKTWIQGGLGVGTYDIAFNVTDVYPNKSLKLFTKLQDYASNVFSNAHLLSLSLNNYSQVYDSGYVDKYQQKVLSADVNSNLLSAGSNALKVHSYNNSTSPNVVALDWFEIEYPRYLKPMNNKLLFSFPFLQNSSVKCIHIRNVPATSFNLWKYGSEFKKYIVPKSSSEIFINDTVNSTNKFVLADSQKVLKPIFYYQKKFVNLRSKSNSADYIAITHKLFKSKAEEYCNFITQNYHIKTSLVLIDDIYDEFDYGYFNPETIRDFLKITKSEWSEPTPKYVFLIGDANYDYYRYKETNFGVPRSPNYVPSFGAPVSDNWYVFWDSTGASIPQMNIGRLPVKSNEELNEYLKKHRNYVSRPYDEWNKRYLLFSGGNFTDASQIAQFKGVNDNLIKSYIEPQPIGGIAHHFYKTVNPVSNFGPFSQEEIKSAIEQGSIFVAYLGHSGTQTWDNSITDPTQLNNGFGNPLITDFGCSTARFAEPDITSFSELFVNGISSQAIAYIGNSSLGFTSTALTFPQLFYSTILADSVYNISEALKTAKMKLIQQYGAQGVYSVFVMTNTLIGDPIISLPIPKLPNLSIQGKDVAFGTKIIDDQIDSLGINIKYFNLGKVSGDTVAIKVSDESANKMLFNKVIKRRMPAYADSIMVYLPIKNTPGEHKLAIKLDEGNAINEIYKNDNTLEINFNVSSSSLKSLLSYQLENQTDKVKLLTPVINPRKSEGFTIQVSALNNFSDYKSYNARFDTFSTVFKLDSLVKGNRYWSRALVNGNTNYSNLQSFVYGEKLNYSVSDSIGFSTCSFDRLKYANKKVYLDTLKNKIRAISAGFSDGNTAVIEKNSQNFIPENTLRGHHICLFDAKTYEFKGYFRFDLEGGSEVTNNYIRFLDTLSEKYILTIAVSDEGVVSSPELKNKLKGFGSKYIDSLQFRGSWTLIGQKGAIPGSVPEKYSKPFDGRIEIEKTSLSPNSFGRITSGAVGPARKWKNIIIGDDLPPNTSIVAKIIGVKSNALQDTLGQIKLDKKTSDISFINAKDYPKIKILAEFNASAEGISPALNSLGVDYTGIAELGTNYQVVSISKDSVQRGEPVELNFSVHNAGESVADSFNVKVEVIKSDNTHETVFQSVVDSLSPDSKKSFHLMYNTSNSSGARNFYISIDPENKVEEFYKDNNYFSTPFYIKPDTTRPTLKVSFDGRDIFDGEYVSSKPDIKVELSDKSFLPITDTSAIKLFLNDRPVSYGSSKELKIAYNSSNPKVVLNYNPVLEDGDYTLRIIGKNAAGNFADSAGITKTFQVSNNIKLIDLYNYPNPFNNDTYFTFKLTQIPDEFKIKIYTVAGRMVKEIVKNPTDLRFDFNKIYWDGRDQDGDLLANGVYLYKIMMTKGGKTDNYLQKIAIIR